MSNKKIMGIDLGTTNSAVSIVEVKDPVIIPNAEGNRTTPSVVSFAKNGSGERKIGMAAKRQAVMNPTNTISSVKRFMGKNYTAVADVAAKMPYKVTPGDKDTCMIPIGKRHYTPQEISAMLLQKLANDTNNYLKQNIKKAVITVPAYFSDQERHATKEAGAIAGLEVVRIINEPTAAALAYGLKQQQENGQKNLKIVVYDFGGGTFDISILECEDGVFEVKATSGDVNLGGDDIDEKIIAWLVEEFRKQEGIDLRNDISALQRLREAAEKAKKELSSVTTTEINLPFLSASEQGPKHLVISLTRSKFEHLCQALIERTLEPCRKALKASGFSTQEIDKVILVGGSTRIPKVEEEVKKFFGKEPTKGISPEEVVALGAAVQGAILAGDIDDIVLLDVTPLSLGIETKGGVVHKLIPANTTIPTKKSEVFSTADDGQTSVEIKICQGERPMAKDNKLLARFHLDGIPSAPRGKPQIEVTFDIDVNGIVAVSAKDKDSGKSQSIRIESSSLSEDEIEKMKKEAELYGEQDKKEKEKINTLNKAESTLFQLEQMLKEDGEAVDAEQRKKLDTFLDDLKKAHADKKAEKVEELLKAHETFLAEIYQLLFAAKMKREEKAKKEQPKDPKDEEKVKDVDFEEVEDKEKK